MPVPVTFVKAKCDNVLFEYNVDRGGWSSKTLWEHLEERYPGDDCCDIISTDFYDTRVDELRQDPSVIRDLCYFADKHGKIPVVREISFAAASGIKEANDDWFTNDLCDGVMDNANCSCPVCMTWINGSDGNYCLPYIETSDIADDLRRFAEREDVVTSDNMVNLYGK